MTLHVFRKRGQNEEPIFIGRKLPNICEEKIIGLIIDNMLQSEANIQKMSKKAVQN